MRIWSVASISLRQWCFELSANASMEYNGCWPFFLAVHLCQKLKLRISPYGLFLAEMSCWQKPHKTLCFCIKRKDMKGQSIVYAAIKFHFLHTWYSNIHTVGTWTLTLTKHLSWQRPLFWAGGKDENELPDQNFDMWQGSTAALRFVPSHQFAATFSTKRIMTQLPEQEGTFGYFIPAC